MFQAALLARFCADWYGDLLQSRQKAAAHDASIRID
jgi:hypothetical protein